MLCMEVQAAAGGVERQRHRWHGGHGGRGRGDGVDHVYDGVRGATLAPPPPLAIVGVDHVQAGGVHDELTHTYI
jgi:hypothetical protein